MKIAFTAPMKPLDHPVPSGDRTMGRLIVRALQAAGHDVETASTFRAWRKEGGSAVQERVREDALAEADRIARIWAETSNPPDLFLTYHLYHKAPDWIGPALADRFDLPYAIVEASRAPKRRHGEWATGFAAADKALARANAVAAIHHADAECLSDVVPADRLEVLLPFLNEAPFAAAVRKPVSKDAPLRLLAVGMMREGDKTRSYEVLSEALQLVSGLPWHLTLAGDGANRDYILSLFPEDRITFAGAKDPEDMPTLYAGHDLLVWPAIREAFGLALLEAQAAGLGVIAGDTFGVPDIVSHGETGLLSPEGDAAAFADNLKTVLDTPEIAERFGRAASRYIDNRHSLLVGAERLDALVQKAVLNHARTRQATP